MDFDLFGEYIAETAFAVPEPVISSNPDLDNPPAATTQNSPTLWGYDTEALERQTATGTNVALFAASGARDPVIFVNQIKAAWPWFARNGGDDTYTLDTEGYVASKADDTVMVSDLLRRSSTLNGIDPFTGSFRIYGEGEGRFSIGTGLQDDLLAGHDTAELSTEVIDGKSYWYVDFDYTPAPDGKNFAAKMFLQETLEGDHIRDLALVHHSHLDEWRAGETFAPEFLSDLKPFKQLRFMDWMNTNVLYLDKDGRAADPEQRYISVNHFTYNTRAGGGTVADRFPSSVPIEMIVELANLTGADPWINLPADITDARTGMLADYVEENLDPGLTAIWEYGNEIWNYAHGFKSYTHAARMAADTFDDFDTPSLKGAAEWAAYRGPQLYDLIAGRFDADAPGLRFVAPMWAYDGPVQTDGSIDTNSWSAIYFAAEQAQSMADAPSRPVDIVTDYAVGLYFGGIGSTDDPEIASGWVLKTFDTVAEQAEAIAKLQIFGADPDKTVDLGVAALDAPVTDLVWDEVQHLAVGRLIRSDVLQGGVHPMDGLTEVLRFVDNELQYRGLRAAEWTTVAVFDHAPERSIEQMARDITLTGWSFKRDGKVSAGLQGSIAANTAMRLDGHLAFVEALGLDFAGYEGGPHIGEKYGPTSEMYAAYTADGWAALTQNAWYDRLDRADLDTFMSYMSHDRYARDTDNWGLRDYTGQPLAEASKARLLSETAAAGTADGNSPVIDRPLLEMPGGASGPAPDSEPLPDVDAGTEAPRAASPGFEPDGWDLGNGWSFDDAGGVVQTSGSGSVLETGKRFDVEPGNAYRLELFVAEAGEQPGRLRIVVTAHGGGATQVGHLETVVTQGQHVVLDLDTIPEPHDGIEIRIRRHGNADGELVLNAFELTLLPDVDAGTEAPDAASPGFEPDGWELGNNWYFDDAGGVVQTSGSGSILETGKRLDVEPGNAYRLELFVAEAGEQPGRLRIVVTAHGGGATQVGHLETVVTQGQHVVLDLDTIPEPHDGIEIRIRRHGNAQGELVLNAFELTLLPEVDAGREAPDAAERPPMMELAPDTFLLTDPLAPAPYQDPGVMPGITLPWRSS